MAQIMEILKASGEFDDIPDENLVNFIKSKGIDKLKEFLGD